LQALYACECGDVTEPAEDFSNVTGDEQLPRKVAEYAHHLVDLVRENREWADSQISRLARNWTLGRIAAVDRHILRMAMVELEHMPDVPVKVVLNEAIELAKMFSTGESSAFVNGILDNFVKQMKDE